MPPTADAIKAELVNITNRCIDKYNLGKEDENAPANAKMRDRFPDMKEGNDKFPKLRSLTPRAGGHVRACVASCRRSPVG